jgi:hypothetical protein
LGRFAWTALAVPAAPGEVGASAPARPGVPGRFAAVQRSEDVYPDWWRLPTSDDRAVLEALQARHRDEALYVLSAALDLTGALLCRGRRPSG